MRPLGNFAMEYITMSNPKMPPRLIIDGVDYGHVDRKNCDPELLLKYIKHLQEEAEYQAMVRAELRYGC